VKAVAEAIKRYKYTVQQVLFVNNSIRPRDSVKIVESIVTHMPNLLVLNLSKNELGPEGSKFLATQIPKMSKLKELRLANCNITDRGAIEVVSSLDEINSIDCLDLSGNKLG
jgi:Ran GTPase-activating protein (RanGAP) involved in mRNA processing and transport